MKALGILSILLFYSVSALSQEHADTNWVHIDSVRYNLSKTFIDPKNVKHFYTEPHPDDTIYTTHKLGKLRIERKKKSRIISLSHIINEVRSNHKIADDERITVVVDGIVLTNPEEYYIEESYIKKITIITSLPEERHDHKYHGSSIIIKTKGRKKKSI